MYVTYSHKILRFPGLQRGERAAVEQQTVCHLCDELQREVAFEAWPYGRKPSIAVAMETMLGLLTFGSIKLCRALTSEKQIKYINKIIQQGGKSLTSLPRMGLI